MRVRFTSSPADRRGVTGMLSLGALAALSATAGLMAVLLLLSVCAVPALRVPVAVFREQPSTTER